MPLYDYDCLACGRRVEVVHGVHAPGPAHCPSCGAGPLKKAIAAPAVHFKGSGWAKKERRATAAPGTSKTANEGETGSGSESGSTDGDKPATGAIAKPAAENTSTTASKRGSGAATTTD